jgi:hypothetical protein
MLRDRGLRKVHSSRKRAGVYNSPGSFYASEFLCLRVSENGIWRKLGFREEPFSAAG